MEQKNERCETCANFGGCPFGNTENTQCSWLTLTDSARWKPKPEIKEEERNEKLGYA